MSSRFLCVLTLSLFSSTTVLWSSLAAAQTPLTQAIVQSLRRQVRLMPQNQRPRSARVNDRMVPGDAVTTARLSLVELRFNDRSLARIGEQALFHFAPNTRTFDLRNGTVLLLIPRGQGVTRLKTPNAAAGIKGSALFARCIAETNTSFFGALTKSEIEISNQDGTQRRVLEPGEMATVVNNRIVNVQTFDLQQFYETSSLVEGLDLTQLHSSGAPDAALDGVREETVAALRHQALVRGDGVVENPDYLKMPQRLASSGFPDVSLPSTATDLAPGIERSPNPLSPIVTGVDAANTHRSVGRTPTTLIPGEPDISSGQDPNPPLGAVPAPPLPGAAPAPPLPGPTPGVPTGQTPPPPVGSVPGAAPAPSLPVGNPPTTPTAATTPTASTPVPGVIPALPNTPTVPTTSVPPTTPATVPAATIPTPATSAMPATPATPATVPTAVVPTVAPAPAIPATPATPATVPAATIPTPATPAIPATPATPATVPTAVVPTVAPAPAIPATPATVPAATIPTPATPAIPATPATVPTAVVPTVAPAPAIPAIPATPVTVPTAVVPTVAPAPAIPTAPAMPAPAAVVPTVAPAPAIPTAPATPAPAAVVPTVAPAPALPSATPTVTTPTTPYIAPSSAVPSVSPTPTAFVPAIATPTGDVTIEAARIAPATAFVGPAGVVDPGLTAPSI